MGTSKIVLVLLPFWHFSLIVFHLNSVESWWNNIVGRRVGVYPHNAFLEFIRVVVILAIFGRLLWWNMVRELRRKIWFVGHICPTNQIFRRSSLTIFHHSNLPKIAKITTTLINSRNALWGYTPTLLPTILFHHDSTLFKWKTIKEKCQNGKSTRTILDVPIF